MNQELINSIADYVEKNIGEFHKARIAKLQSINLKELLSRKNPYMYKAKNIVTAGQMVESLASAYMSSAEESIFGNWMEGIASFVAEKVYDGHKSAAEGIDLEFDKEGVHYFVSVKSESSPYRPGVIKAAGRFSSATQSILRGFCVCVLISVLSLNSSILSFSISLICEPPCV